MKLYKQSTPYTSSAACVMMLLEHHKKIVPNKELEYEIYLKTINPPTKYSNILGVINYLNKYEIKPTLHSENVSFNYPDYRWHKLTKLDIEIAKKFNDMYVNKSKFILKNELSIEELLKFKKPCMIKLNTKFLRETKSNETNYVIFYQGKIYDPAGKIFEENVKETLEKSINSLINTRKEKLRVLSIE